MPPNADTLNPISVEESTAYTLAPYVSAVFSMFIICSSFKSLNIELEKTRDSTDFNFIASSTSLNPITYFSSPLLTCNMILSNIADTKDILLELITSLSEEDLRNTITPVSYTHLRAHETDSY